MNFFSRLSRKMIKTELPQAAAGVPQAATYKDFSDLLNPHGVFVSSSKLNDDNKRQIAMRYAYAQRAEVAMTICSMPAPGDYFEFGSEGLGTFRNFLTAYDLHGFGGTHAESRFYAFDIFGDDVSTTYTPTPGRETTYFKAWSNKNASDKFAEAASTLADHNLMVDRCILKKGYFQDTLTADFKKSLMEEQRRIGTLFMDCNIGESYRVVFDWSLDIISTTRCFVYMDEYYSTSAVRGLFEDFCSKVQDRYGMRANLVRNAGAFGALFLFMRG